MSSASSTHQASSPVAAALLPLAALSAVLALLVPPAWEWMNTDDPRMQFMVAGVGTGDGPDSHVLYMNVFLADALATFYSQSPDVPWYGVMMIGTLSLSWFLMLEAVLSLQPPRAVRLALLACLIIGGTYLWTHLQFTTVATSAATAGLMQLLAAVLQESADKRFRWLRVLMAWGLVIYSSLIREHSCYLIGMVALPAALLTAREFRTRIDLVRHCGAALAGIVTVFVLAKANLAVYERDAGWQKFREFEQPMAVVINNHRLRSLYLSEGKIRFPEGLRERHQETLSKIGWSENDLNLFLMFYFNDAEVYSADALKTIQAEILESPWHNPTHLAVMLLATVYKVARNGMFLAMLLLALAVAVSDRSVSRRRTLSVVWASAIAVCWLVYVTGKLPDRVLVPAATAALLLTVLMPIRPASTQDHSAEEDAATDSAESPKQIGLGPQVVILLAAGLAAWQLVESWRAAQDAKRDREALITELQAVADDDQYFYVVLQPMPFSLLPPLSNNRFLNEWRYTYSDGHQRDPVDQRMLGKSGIRNLTDAIAAGDRIRIIGPRIRIEMLAKFIEEHRHRALQLERVSEGRFLTVYDVTSKPREFKVNPGILPDAGSDSPETP